MVTQDSGLIEDNSKNRTHEEGVLNAYLQSKGFATKHDDDAIINQIPSRLLDIGEQSRKVKLEMMDLEIN